MGLPGVDASEPLSVPSQTEHCIVGVEISKRLNVSVIESLHKEVLPIVAAKHGGEIPDRWGVGLIFLRSNNVLTVAEEQFARGLYMLMSDEAVHPLIAEREYARLGRNMVIEYGLLFLRKLEKMNLIPSKTVIQ